MVWVDPCLNQVAPFLVAPLHRTNDILHAQSLTPTLDQDSAETINQRSSTGSPDYGAGFQSHLWMLAQVPETRQKKSVNQH